MGWSGSITANSAAGTEITYSPTSKGYQVYEMTSFKAPMDGVYRFTLYGSGGNKKTETTDSNAAIADGGKGGKTVGYLSMTAGQTVYIGCGDTCCAAWVATKTATSLDGVGRGNMLFMAGGGGEGGVMTGRSTNNKAGKGGNGGGKSGTAGSDGEYSGEGGAAGGQSGSTSMSAAGGEYNVDSTGASCWAGSGGDGYYAGSMGSHSGGGGGGSGYIKTASVTLNGTTYTSTTTAGGGAASDTNGYVQVRYHAAGNIPVIFNGVRLQKLIFNGVEVKSLIYDGTKLFMRRLSAWVRRGGGLCLRFTARAS